MRYLRNISLLVGLLLWSMQAMSVPAYRGAIPYVDAHGDTTQVYLHGDENCHWMTTDSLSDEAIAEHMLRHSPRRVLHATQNAAERNLAPRGLVILVNFSDVAFRYSRSEIEDKLMGENSARQYFYEQSHGRYNPHFDVVGPYTVSHNQSYYGSNDNSGLDMHPDEMVIEACQAADQEGVDFSQYDHNSDGIIDFVYIIYAGKGEADSGIETTIWPHTSNVTKVITLDGKRLDIYSCGSECNYLSQQAGIGTFCHEFCHVLGLMDTYITTQVSRSWKTMGSWDIMDYGPYNNNGNTPPAMSLFERFFLGWATPYLAGSVPQTLLLHELQSSNTGVIITESGESNLVGNDPNPTTYWLLENRQQTGWDQYIPGSGMMLTKVHFVYDRWVNCTFNNYADDQGIDLIEADGYASATSRGKASDLFPIGATSYSGIPYHTLSNISMQDGVVQVDINGGGQLHDLTDLCTPQATPLVRKMLINGQLILRNSDTEYTITGQQL